MKMVNKRVRAYNLKPGDELDWFDSKAKEAVAMVVKSADPESDALHGDYVRVVVTYRDKEGPPMAYGSPRNSLVRVRRESK